MLHYREDFQTALDEYRTVYCRVHQNCDIESMAYEKAFGPLSCITMMTYLADYMRALLIKLTYSFC